MILHFPDLDTLHLVLMAGMVPEKNVLAPAITALGVDGSLWIQPNTALGKNVLEELGKLSVRPVARSVIPLDQKVCCWLQLLPIARDPQSMVLGEKTPILFDLNGSQLAEVVGEMLRLGNDRQAFRWIRDGNEERALLRVLGPPYYTLLRALESDDTGPRAYRECVPRVWVQYGYSHPLIQRLAPSAGRMLLLQPPRQWTILAEDRFRDIYEALEFPLTHAPTHWAPSELPHRLRVPLRLVRGGSNDPAELWVMAERGIEQVDSLVRECDDQLIQRLTFAVAEKNGQQRVILRARPGKEGPPVLVLEGLAFRSYLKIPNLFLPCGATIKGATQLNPPLRRDAVKSLLASDSSQIHWLFPMEGGEFQCESISDAAFLPLSQWVDYILDHERQALTAWRQATQFDFETCICNEGDREGVSPKKAAREPSAPRAPAPTSEVSPPKVGRPHSAPKIAPDTSAPQSNVQYAPLPKAQVNEELNRLLALEKQFRELEGPLDAPERRDLWQELARANCTLNRSHDTTICWTNRLWEGDYESQLFAAWYADETRGLERNGMSAKTLERLLMATAPTNLQLSQLAAYLAWAGGGNPPNVLAERMSRIQEFLEKYELLLPIRAAWLAWYGLSRMAGGDSLTLAGARDRCLERLFKSGLRPDMDMPSFLRLSKLAASDRSRAVREQLLELHGLVQNWIKGNTPAGASPPTTAYANFVFAFGFAHLGEATRARALVQLAQEELQGSDRIHAWLSLAYEHRVNEVLAGRSPTDRFPRELMDDLEAMDNKMDRYKVDRLRQHSSILEPHEEIEPYRRWHGRYTDDLERELASLFDIENRAVLARELHKHLHREPSSKRGDTERVRVLATALELAPRLGEEFARDLLPNVIPTLDRANDLVERARVLEKSLFLAAHYDKTDYIRPLIERLRGILQEHWSSDNLVKLVSLLSESLRGLRKLGMRDQIHQLLDVLTGLIRKQSQRMGKMSTAERNEERANQLSLLLQVAGGRFYFSQDEHAWPVIEETADLLFIKDATGLKTVTQIRLACDYVECLGQAPIEQAMARLHLLFSVESGSRDPASKGANFRLTRISDNFTTNTHYSLSQIDLLEAMVKGLVGENVQLDRDSRRWLDDDEFLVRRRIHRDVRAAVGTVSTSQAGNR